MTKQEFQERTGSKITDETFNKINLCMTQAKGVTPETFCEEYMHFQIEFWGSAVLNNLAENAALLEEANAKQQHFVEKIKVALLEAALSDDTDKTWARVADVLGAAEVIRYKLDNELDLSADDRAYILNHLK